MSSAGELLAALCTAHGVRIGHIPGGIPLTTAQDVLAVAAKVWSQFESDLMMAKHCLDAHAQRTLRDHAFRITLSEQSLRGWPSSEPGLIHAMAHAVTDEFCGGGRCSVCNGAKENMTAEGKVQVCRRCGGTGLGWESDNRMGSRIGVGRTAYRNNWAHRVDWLRRELIRAEVAADYRFMREWNRNRAA